jgi:hypothetical protein
MLKPVGEAFGSIVFFILSGILVFFSLVAIVLCLLLYCLKHKILKPVHKAFAPTRNAPAA